VTRSLAFLIVTVAVANAGCGGDSGGATDPFVGRWMVTAGTQKVNCGAITVPDSNLAGTFQELKKDTDNTLSIDLTMGCVVKLDVSGTTATVRANQTCTITVMLGNMTLPVNGTITGGKFVVNGTTATFDYMGSATGGGGLFSCTFTASGMSMKTTAAPDAGSSGGG
jgi:hypothetical protein